jgi:predicted metal-dependent hydrolase
MARIHPHAEATYRVIRIAYGAFAVEVTIPETHPAKVSPFATEAGAEAWIAAHRRRVQSENEPRRWFRSSGSSADRRGRP